MAEAHANQHDYHLVNPSPWPIVGAIGAFTMAFGLVMYFISKKAGTPHLWYVLPGLTLVIITMFGWWRDVIIEAKEGYETPVVQLHLRYGMLLFIASEVMFLVSSSSTILGSTKKVTGISAVWPACNVCCLKQKHSIFVK